MTEDRKASRPLWQAAVSLATRAHQGQTRKDGRTPYVAHPIRVALTVAGLFGVTDETVLVAAVLHDTIEDTTIDYDDLHERFGRTVADIVATLSKDARVIEPERERRYDEQMAAGPWQARLIKLADVYDNLSDAIDNVSRRSLVAKARRALSLAAHDECLERPCQIVADFVESMELRLKGR